MSFSNDILAHLPPARAAELTRLVAQHRSGALTKSAFLAAARPVCGERLFARLAAGMGASSLPAPANQNAPDDESRADAGALQDVMQYAGVDLRQEADLGVGASGPGDAPAARDARLDADAGALCVPRLGAHASWRRVLPSGDAIIRVTGAVLAGRPERAVVSLVMGLMAAAEVEDLRAHDVLLYLCGASRRAVGLLVYRSAQVDSTLCALVERVWTAPSHRRRGVGRSLLAALRTCGHGDWAQCDETCALPAAALRFSELTAQGRALAVSFGCVHLPP